MLTPAVTLRKKLASGEPVVGLMSTDHVWPFLVEICQKAGLDYLVVDREHGCHTDETVAHVCQVGRLAGFPVLMRIVACEWWILRRALDLGPCGLIVPCVDSKEQLDRVADAVLMPPRGSRRPGGMGNYWMRDYQYQTWKDEFEPHFIIIPQIENREGVEKAAEIAAHPIVTALGLGPYDLSADLGCCWDPTNEEHREAIRRVKAAADAAGKKVWAGTDWPSLIERGYTFLWTGTVTSTLLTSFRQTVSAIREGSRSGESSAPAPPPA